MRLFVYLVPEVDIIFFGIVIHHFWFGLILSLMIFLLPTRLRVIKIILLALGLGLMIDQIIFLLLGGGKDREYWAFPSLFGAVIVTIAIYFYREKLLKVFKLN